MGEGRGVRGFVDMIGHSAPAGQDREELVIATADTGDG
jgi:hypothetical protein